MNKKAIHCGGLIGDSLYMLKPIDKYLERFGGECAGLVVLPNIGGQLVRAHFKDRVPIFTTEDEVRTIEPNVEFLRMDAGRSLQLCLQHHEKTKEFQHISQGYAFMLGVNVDQDYTPPLEWIPPAKEKHGPLTVVIGPFSASCARHSGEEPNKTIDDWKWENIIRYFRRHGYIVQCGCAPGEFLRFASLPLSSYRSGETLEEMVNIYQNADLVISVDSGTAHISSACGTPTIILWSTYKLAPPPFIAPLWASKTSYIMMGKPSEVVPASLLYGIKQYMNDKFKDVIRQPD